MAGLLGKLRELVDRVATPNVQGENPKTPRWKKEGFQSYGDWHGISLLSKSSPEVQAQYAEMRKRTRLRKAAENADRMGGYRPTKKTKPKKQYEPDVTYTDYPGTIGKYPGRGKPIN